jgi:hypothetical protein
LPAANIYCRRGSAEKMLPAADLVLPQIAQITQKYRNVICISFMLSGLCYNHNLPKAESICAICAICGKPLSAEGRIIKQSVQIRVIRGQPFLPQAEPISVICAICG